MPFLENLYSLEIWISPDESLKDIRVKDVRSFCNFKTKIFQKSSSFLNKPVFSISLNYTKTTAAFFDGIGGIYIPTNLSTSFTLRIENYLYLLRMINSPRGSAPLTSYVTCGGIFSLTGCCSMGFTTLIYA